MKRLLLLITLSLAVPQAVIASQDQKATLLLRGTGVSSTIPMEDMDLCEEQGLVYLSSDKINVSGKTKGYQCFENKR